LQSKLLADENVPWPLVRLLRYMGSDLVWIPETRYRGISDRELVSLTNSDNRVVVTRDNDFLKMDLRRRIKYGLIYIGEPVRRDNIEKLARNIINVLEILKEKPILVIVSSTTVELYPLTP